MVSRPHLRSLVEEGLRLSPVTAILGPRQCGKSTLAREIATGREAVWFDLEDPTDAARLANPKLALERLTGLVVLDEIQRRPELTQLLRVLADRRPLPCRFLILGSASPDLMRQASDSLAGRVHFVDMAGFTLDETGPATQTALWVRGGFPPSFLARSEEASRLWRRNFLRTFLEHDLPQLGVRVAPEMLRRFWTMLAHCHGQTWNASGIGNSLGVSHHTTRHYLDLLAGAFTVRLLAPWFENVGKRVVKSPKVYVRDSGLLHSLLGLADLGALESHPKLGASWEGFALDQLLAAARGKDSYFWGVHNAAELDLLLIAGGRRYGFEFKYSDTPGMTRSLHTALTDLKLERAWIVHPGTAAFPIHDQVNVVPLADALEIARTLPF